MGGRSGAGSRWNYNIRFVMRSPSQLTLEAHPHLVRNKRSQLLASATNHVRPLPARQVKRKGREGGGGRNRRCEG